jgi:hypothetical protein
LKSVLLDADGSNPKGLDLTKLIIEGANRPKSSNVLNQLVQLFTMPWDHCKKVATNVEIFKAKAAQIQTYGIDITPMIVLIIFRNI